MSNQIGELELEDAANEAAGNWKRFQCFVWFREDVSDPDNWAIIYTHHRDSGLLDQSNASVIEKNLEPFTDDDDPDVVMESHSHFLVGHIDGFSIRVFRNGEITEAFKVLHGLMEQMAVYPILCEHHYCEMELEATFENIPLAAAGIKDEYELPEEWSDDVYQWLSDNRPNALENTDDQGGWPNEEDLRAAFDALGYEEVEPAC